MKLEILERQVDCLNVIKGVIALLLIMVLTQKKRREEEIIANAMPIVLPMQLDQTGKIGT